MKFCGDLEFRYSQITWPKFSWGTKNKDNMNCLTNSRNRWSEKGSLRACQQFDIWKRKNVEKLRYIMYTWDSWPVLRLVQSWGRAYLTRHLFSAWYKVEVGRAVGKDRWSQPASSHHSLPRIQCADFLKLEYLYLWYKTKQNGVIGGTKNCTSGARIKILRPFFNTN